MGNEKPITAAPKFQLYNSETGELLGRTAGSWAKISLFYVAYFAFLAGLFTASIQIMKTSIDLEKPKLQTRLNIPGLHYFPKIDPTNKTQTTRLKDNAQVPFFWDNDKTEIAGTFYSTIIEAEKTAYDEKAAKNQEGVTNFNWDTLGECGTAPYGWNTDSPCIFFRVNRVIDWTPVGLFKPEKDSIFEKDGPTQPMQKDAIYIRCESKNLAEVKEGEEAPAGLTFTYFGGSPSDGYISSEFFPYQGKAKQEAYQSPIVGVKVKGLTEKSKYRVKCQAHAKNIVIDTRDNLGHIQFEIQYKGEAKKTE